MSVPRGALTAKDREWHRQRAVRHLVKAAAAMNEGTTPDSLALALLSTGVALLSIASLDQSEAAHDRVHAFLATQGARA